MQPTLLTLLRWREHERKIRNLGVTVHNISLKNTHLCKARKVFMPPMWTKQSTYEVLHKIRSIPCSRANPSFFKIRFPLALFYIFFFRVQERYLVLIPPQRAACSREMGPTRSFPSSVQLAVTPQKISQPIPYLFRPFSQEFVLIVWMIGDVPVRTQLHSCQKLHATSERCIRQRIVTIDHTKRFVCIRLEHIQCMSTYTVSRFNFNNAVVSSKNCLFINHIKY